MAVRVAEYLGQRTDVDTPVIQPATKGAMCPFMNAECTKVRKGYKPVCSVRKEGSGSVWIVCPHRLCATLKTPPLTSYQETMLHDIAKLIFHPDIAKEDVLVKREVQMPVVGNSRYNADYIMVNNSDKRSAGSNKVVLEMQGGGETSNTGLITALVNLWENDPERTNEDLRAVSGAGTIETNAWRRQQEQFIIKGNISGQTGGGIVFCVGRPLYDYLYERVSNANLNDLRDDHWTLAIIGYDENDEDPLVEHSINYRIDPTRILFTNYVTFVQTLINQGQPYRQMFVGDFTNLDQQVVSL